MKIIEKPTDIEIEGAKFHTASRPKNLNPILNSVNLSLIVGLPASGKSSLIKNLLLNPKLYNNVFNSVYYISPSDTMDLPLPEEKLIVLDKEDLSTILEDIVEVEREEERDEDDPHRVLIILDDAINYLSTNKKAMSIFRKLSMNGRHILGRNSSVALWIVSQKIKSVPLTIRAQTNQLWFFDSTRGEKEVVRDEFTPLDKKEADQLYDYVFDAPHNFLFINLLMPKNKRMFKNFNQLIIKDFN